MNLMRGIFKNQQRLLRRDQFIEICRVDLRRGLNIPSLHKGIDVAILGLHPIQLFASDRVVLEMYYADVRLRPSDIRCRLNSSVQLPAIISVIGRFRR